MSRRLPKLRFAIVCCGAMMFAQNVHAGKYGGSFSHATRAPVTPGYYPRPMQTPSTSRAAPVARPFLNKSQQWREVLPGRPDTLKAVGGSGAKVPFNRRSLGGASGMNSALRKRFYASIDRKTKSKYDKVFQNKKGAALPLVDRNNKPIVYEERRAKDAKQSLAQKLSNARLVIALGSENGKTTYDGCAYGSRHYGDTECNGKQGKVLWIQ